MPAARYWRIVAIDTYAGADLELSALHLYGGAARLDAAATISSTFAPVAGTLAALQDDDLASTCRFAGDAVRSGGFAIIWDFGAGNTADVLGPRLSGPSRDAFLARCMLQYSTDGKLWQWQADFSRYDFPGAGAYTNAPVVASYRSLVLGAAPRLYWCLDETSGTVAADASGNGNSGTYTSDAASFTTVGLVDGNRAISLAGTNGLIGITKAASPLNHTQSWTAVILAQPAAKPPLDGVGVLWVLGESGSPEIDVLDAGGGRFRIRVMVSGQSQLFVSSSSWVYGTKVLAVARYDGSVIRLNVNGGAEGQASCRYGNHGGVLRIGFAVFGSATAYYPLSGVLDEFSLHQSLLSDAQVQALNVAFAGGGGGGVGPVFLPTLLRAPAPELARIAAASPVPPHSALSAPPLLLARDMEFGGSGRIWGTTKIETSPGSRVPTKARVSILRGRDKLLAREVWSDPVTGEWEVNGLDTRQDFVVLAQDSAGNYQPVAADKTMPEAP